MLAVIGAEFGHEITPKRGSVVEEPKKTKKGQEGFTLSNYSLARHTSKYNKTRGGEGGRLGSIVFISVDQIVTRHLFFANYIFKFIIRDN